MDQGQRDRIEQLLKDSFLSIFLDSETITDISFNGTSLWIKDNLKGTYRPNEQPTADQVFTLGRKIADEMGKEFANNEPILDTELSYLRVDFVHQEVSPSGCTFSIRISRPQLQIKDLSDLANDDVAKLLDTFMKGEMNIIVAGRTGTGKTELQKTLVGSIPDNKYITLIEDTMDSHIKEIYPQKNINSWRTLMSDTREKKIDHNTLIKAGLRNDPDWLIIAETRGSEAYNMVEAALTDHSIITTLHAKKRQVYS